MCNGCRAGPRCRMSARPRQRTSTEPLRKLFSLLRAQTGHDFSRYKRNTIVRRIDRRMVVNRFENLEAYVAYLQQTPEEVVILFRELLIGVTNFFRDPEVFALLEKTVIPALFAEKQMGETVRVWVPGCSTGEEAYSIAILLQEHMPPHPVRGDRADLRHRHRRGSARPGAHVHIPEQHRGGCERGAAVALFRGRWRFVPAQKGRARHGRLCGAKRGRGPAFLAYGPGVVPQRPDLHERGPATPGLAPVPLRPEPERLPASGHLREHRRVHRPVRHHRSEAQALHAAKPAACLGAPLWISRARPCWPTCPPGGLYGTYAKNGWTCGR